jgi:hypothetical protein
MGRWQRAVVEEQDVWNALARADQTLDAAFGRWTADHSAATRLALADAATAWVIHLECVLGQEAGCRYRTALLAALDGQERAQRVVGALASKRELTPADRRLMQQVWAEEREARREYEDVEASTYVALARERERQLGS